MNVKKFSENLAKKLRELELICAPLKTDAAPGKIDIELALEKARELYELIAKEIAADTFHLPEVREFQKEIPVIGQTEIKLPASEEKAESKVFEVKTHAKYIDVTKKSSTERTAPLKQNITEMVASESYEPVSEVSKDFTVAAQSEPPLRVHTKEQKPIIAEKFQKTDNNFINENLGKGKKIKDLTSKIQAKPINDLRASIGINEKFLFTKELFNGNSDLYGKSLDFLNHAGSLDNAMQYIQENFGWDMENDTTHKFLELVKRKFQK